MQSRGPDGSAAMQSLFDHLVGADKQCGWHNEAERLGGLEVDDQLRFRGLLSGQVGRFLAPEYPAGIDAYLATSLREISTIAHQAAGRRELAELEDRGQPVTVRQ